MILAQHLQHAGARDAGDQRHEAQAERKARQDKMAQEGPEAVGQRTVALDRQQFQLDGKNVDEHVADHEYRERKAQHREAHHAAIDRRAGAPCGEHADRHGERDCDDRGENRERDGRLDALEEQRRHRAIAEDRDAEIALQRAGEPQDELLVKRQIETELAADRLYLLLGRLIARDHAGRIAGRDMQNGEHHQCDDGEHRDGRQDAADRIGPHRAQLAAAAAIAAVTRRLSS